jgi:hypothetical protein
MLSKVFFRKGREVQSSPKKVQKLNFQVGSSNMENLSFDVLFCPYLTSKDSNWQNYGISELRSSGLTLTLISTLHSFLIIGHFRSIFINEIVMWPSSSLHAKIHNPKTHPSISKIAA